MNKYLNVQNKDFKSIITKENQMKIKIKKGLSILNFLALERKNQKATHFLYEYYKKQNNIRMKNKYLKLINELSYIQSRIKYFINKKEIIGIIQYEFYLNIKFNQSLITKDMLNKLLNITSNIIENNNESNIKIQDYIYIANFLHHTKNDSYIYFYEKYFEKLNIDFTYLNVNSIPLLYALQMYISYKIKNNQLFHIQEFILNITKHYKNLNINNIIIYLLYNYHLIIINIRKRKHLTDKDILYNSDTIKLYTSYIEKLYSKIKLPKLSNSEHYQNVCNSFINFKLEHLNVIIKIETDLNIKLIKDAILKNKYNQCLKRKYINVTKKKLTINKYSFYYPL